MFDELRGIGFNILEYNNTNNFIGLTDNSISDLEELTPLLIKFKSLALSDDACELFSQIPTYIERLCIDFDTYDNIHVDRLHNGLKELYILDETGGDDFNLPIDNLPQTLKVLYIESDNFNQSVSNLPSSLKQLIIHSNKFNQPLNKLPISLEKLEIMDMCFDDSYDKVNDDLLNLPQSIKQLNISSRKFRHLNKKLIIVRQKYKNLSICI